ncbi:MAG: TIM barrel protein [Nanoarchaeota archaeon]
MKNYIFIPTYAGKASDIQASLKIAQSLSQGYVPGLMLVIKGGVLGVGINSRVQYENLVRYQAEINNEVVIVMLSVFPLEELDIIHHALFAVNHIKQGIDFTSNLPLGKRKILTFHLNDYVSKEEFFSRSKKEWMEYFKQNIAPLLKEIGTYAREKNIEVKIETVPLPQFGDVPLTDKRTYLGVSLRELRSPFYLTHLCGFTEIREQNLGICLDICHARTIYHLARSKEAKEFLFSEDIDFLKNTSLEEDVHSLLSTDLVHLNDGKGFYSRESGIFYEGVALGEGDIPNLREIVMHLNGKKVPLVLEINEEDFEQRPHTRTSIAFLSSL